MQSVNKTYNLQSLGFLRDTTLKVGLLGGSFNPAHQGHVSVSLCAMQKLNLDYIIWLVALQNTLKPAYQFGIFERAAQAASIISHRRILVSTAEYDINSPHSYDVISVLSNKFYGVNFTWLMGADNMQHFHKWRKYREISKKCNIAIFDRPQYSCYINFSRFDSIFNVDIEPTTASKIAVYRTAKLQISSSVIRSQTIKNDECAVQ